MPRASAAQKKAAAQAKLQERQHITLTIDMTENNFQRLAALLLFADHESFTEVEKTGPLPWEAPVEMQSALPALEIDYEVVRREIVKRLAAYLDKHGRDQAIELLKAHGGDTLPKIPQHRLLELHDALA